MPRPNCQGMRPKRKDPNSLSTSAQARLARMLVTTLLRPISGGSWLPDSTPAGARLVRTILSGVEPRMVLSRRSTWAITRTWSLMLMVGSRRRRMLPLPRFFDPQRVDSIAHSSGNGNGGVRENPLPAPAMPPMAPPEPALVVMYD